METHLWVWSMESSERGVSDNINHGSVVFRCPIKLWQVDSDPAWTIAGHWDWNSYMQFSHHPFYYLSTMTRQNVICGKRPAPRQMIFKLYIQCVCVCLRVRACFFLPVSVLSCVWVFYSPMSLCYTCFDCLFDIIKKSLLLPFFLPLPLSVRHAFNSKPWYTLGFSSRSDIDAQSWDYCEFILVMWILNQVQGIRGTSLTS